MKGMSRIENIQTHLMNDTRKLGSRPHWPQDSCQFLRVVAVAGRGWIAIVGENAYQ
jgi:hypothetical protein